MPKTTSWGTVASWYHDHLKGEGTYQSSVILPNILRRMNIKKGDMILDLACGEGFFSRAFEGAGAKVVGVDISPELITLARKNSSKSILFHISKAHQLSMILSASVDKVVCILALQNIAEVKEVFSEIKRVLKPSGRAYVVLNHPAFRIPKRSSWAEDGTGHQYRRVDGYMSEHQEEIVMHPGRNKDTTISFHRPLQYYGKLISATGLAITRIEEWISDKKSQTGPKKKEEDRMRKEIPLFLYLELTVV